MEKKTKKNKEEKKEEKPSFGKRLGSVAEKYGSKAASVARKYGSRFNRDPKPMRMGIRNPISVRNVTNDRSERSEGFKGRNPYKLY